MEEGDNAVTRLAGACHEAFRLYPNSCSHAVFHVIKQYKPTQPFMTANQLVHDLARNPEWREVSVQELASYANQGELIVGGLEEQRGHGHVVAVFPGHEAPAAGYDYTNRAGESVLLRRRGSYARVMSTSMGHWPGAKSNGEKTVWDPWGNDDQFKKVRFWRYVGPTSTVHSQRDEAKKVRNRAEEIWI